MPNQFLIPVMSISIFAPLLTAFFAWRTASAETARRYGVWSLVLSFCCLLFASLHVAFGIHQSSLAEGLTASPNLFASLFVIDALNAVPLPLFAALALGTLAFAPKRKVTQQWVAGVLILSAATLAAYATANLAIFGLAWVVSLAPFFAKKFFNVAGEQEMPGLARAILAASCVMVIAGFALLIALAPANELGGRLSMALPRLGNAPALNVAFALLMVAVFLRKGLFPAHSWMLASFERGPMLPLTLLVNGHLGAFMIARLILPMLPDVSRAALSLLGDLGLLTALYTALLAFAERQPRRLLAMLSIGQASFLLIGLESANADGIAGALVHWQVVAIATTILALVYTAIEARLNAPWDGIHSLGLASGAPRFAVFFAIGGLALVGLPLTLGFCAEDLLLHGTLASHPHLGIIQPIVTALNAFHVVRLFVRLFLGQPGREARVIVDARPRERWILTAAILFLILGGLYPTPLMHLPSTAAQHLVSGLDNLTRTALNNLQ